MIRETALSSSHPLLRVRETGHIGLGIFTDEPITCGALTLMVEGSERIWRSKNDTDAHTNPNWIGIGPNRWIDPEGISKFLNHSCEPNLGFRSERELVAIRDIAAGEHLAIDYATTEDEVHWLMACACGTRSCRKTIRAVQFLAADTFARLYPHMLPYFRRVHEQATARAAPRR